jgi:ATP dependent DNA ligase C terminal region/Ku70/Ku80 beta-barrel domain
MRAIWKGSISFGLISVPISLYPATRREELRFHLLRKSDLSPINYRRIAEADGKEVPWDEIVKGYEYEKGKYVVLKEEDFRRADIEATQSIEVTEFVPLTQPKGGRTHFGALLVGYHEGGQLRFAAKVGTGFDLRRLASLHERFRKLEQKDCPFANLPEHLGTAGRGLTAREMRQCTWLKPRLVCEVRFAEWTRDHHLRQPAFLGLREDKPPKEVVRERPV